jgi:hypothetical protein
MEMKEVQQQALEKALRILDALQGSVKYKVITEQGDEYGELEVMPPKKKNRLPRVHYAAYTELYKNKMQVAQVGDVLQFSHSDIAAAGGTPESMRSTITAYACGVWGKGNYTSTVTNDNVEIMRLG